jgi:hypothetical protein
MPRTARIVLGIVIALAVPAGYALALGFRLGESKEKLELKYDVSVYDHDTGRVTVQFKLEDEGRLKPITSIDLHIPSDDMHEGGGFKSDLTISMATSKEGTKQVGRVHIRKEWAARAELQIKSGHLDGKREMLTWYYHAIPLKDLMSRAKPHETVN